MGRPRSFDWDEANRLRSEGATIKALAERFGVHPNSIRIATDPAYRAATQRRHDEWQRGGTCSECGGQCTRPYGRCSLCAAAAQANVRDGEAWCPACQQWLPIEAFSPSSRRPARGVRGECRACGAKRRTAYRHAHAEQTRAYDRERKRRRRAIARLSVARQEDA